MCAPLLFGIFALTTSILGQHSGSQRQSISPG